MSRGCGAANGVRPGKWRRWLPGRRREKAGSRPTAAGSTSPAIGRRAVPGDRARFAQKCGGARSPHRRSWSSKYPKRPVSTTRACSRMAGCPSPAAAAMARTICSLHPRAVAASASRKRWPAISIRHAMTGTSSNRVTEPCASGCPRERVVSGSPTCTSVGAVEPVRGRPRAVSPPRIRRRSKPRRPFRRMTACCSSLGAWMAGNGCTG
jgi:hypothetical protein